MYTIGITGGVGCGKSAVLQYLKEAWHFRVLELDRVGHDMLLPESPCFERVKDLFGPKVLNPDGTVSRSAVAQLVFRDESLLHSLNQILHPAIRESALLHLRRFEKEGTAFCAVEAALLLEVHFDAVCDETWYIYADIAARRERLMSSRGYSEERIRSMTERQLSDGEFRERCGTVIDNSGDLQKTREQIDRRMNEIIRGLKESEHT